jgi:hypothetical protein
LLVIHRPQVRALGPKLLPRPPLPPPSSSSTWQCRLGPSLFFLVLAVSPQ